LVLPSGEETWLFEVDGLRIEFELIPLRSRVHVPVPSVIAVPIKVPAALPEQTNRFCAALQTLNAPLA